MKAALTATVVLGATVIFFPTARMSAADEAAPTLKAVDVKLPAGAARADDKPLREGFGRMLAAWAAERELKPGDKTAEVLTWSGTAYKPGRAAATQAALERTLSAAGYKIESFHRNDVRTSPFEEEHGLARPDQTHMLDLSPFDRQTFFVATSAEKKQTLVGAWFDQDKRKRLILVVARAEYKADPADAPLPDVTGDDVMLVKDVNDVMKGAALPKLTLPKMAAKPGRVCGVAVNANGDPLEGVRVVIESSAAGGFATSVTATTDAKGVYDIAVPQGACRVVMSGYTVRYNDRDYALPLHPADGACESFASATGHIEHLVLLNHGVADPAAAAKEPKHGGFYYGGSVRVTWLTDDIPPGGTVEVTLTPQGKLLDGTKGKTLVIRLPNKTGGDMNVNNIPIGRYEMTARLLEGGDATPLRVRTAKVGSKKADGLRIDFEPKGTKQVFTNTGGIERFDVCLSF